VSLVENDDVVEAFATDRSDKALCRRSWHSTTKANKMRKVAVGMVKNSIATMSVR